MEMSSASAARVMTFIENITMTTIQAQVSPATLNKVSRLFNSSLTDCFNFAPSEDCDSDSVYTQQEDFREMAYERVAKALLTREAALRARMEMTAERHLRWMVPLNQKLEIRLVARGKDDPAIVFVRGGMD
jgi:hypothetical protein